jgi:hypothetical protein
VNRRAVNRDVGSWIVASILLVALVFGTVIVVTGHRVEFPAALVMSAATLMIGYQLGRLSARSVATKG